MNTKTLLASLAGAVAIVGLLLYVGHQNSNALSSHLPPKVKFPDQVTAFASCLDWTRANVPKGHVTLTIGTSGTPSMEPYTTGKNNLLIVDRSVPFEQIQQYDYVAYHATWYNADPAKNLVGHIVAEITGDGLIMSGINNSRSDDTVNGHIVAVTKDTYFGKVLYEASW